MKHFFALPAVLRTAALLASASQNTFSVQDDLLAFPQYEIKFVDDWTGEKEAQSRLASNQPTEDAKQDVQQYQKPLGSSEDGRPEDLEEAEYERMIIDGQPWLCRIPIVKKPEPSAGVNDTLSKAEEEKELARANERGWELISAMQGNCVYFISGWWSYRFCYNQGVKQFHQLPPSRGVPVYPPVEDPGVPGFMLGSYDKRIDDDDATKEEKWDQSALDVSEGAKRRYSKHGELVQRGESRYLVQKLGGGTVCDLTGKERKIEVQFHCNPQSSDRISLIKETSTCAYLMVIQTPRLCNDVAFLPPQKDQANAITCSPILKDDQIEDYERNLKAAISAEQEAKIWEATQEAAAALGDGAAAQELEPMVGDIFVGERRLVPEGIKLEKSAIVGGGKETYVDTVASSDGRVLTKDEMEKLGLGDPKAIEKLRKELEKIAQGQNWKLDVIDTPGGREYRGIIGDEDEEEQGKSGDDKAKDNKENTKDANSPKGEGKKKEAEKKLNKQGDTNAKKPQSKEKKAKEQKQREGSEEEYYKEEL
ncbi:Protein OS-9-like [Pseudocercospora fuligena]|uniref:Endoplasmic reticulum lectin n=1 Tax=Pseudocercospora fuligena TaxID=685502 RepID=A0A8H6VK52_9PEZI|nr:Protein OS-9-like [Pseudocercospora fuligena]